MYNSSVFKQNDIYYRSSNDFLSEINSPYCSRQKWYPVPITPPPPPPPQHGDMIMSRICFSLYWSVHGTLSSNIPSCEWYSLTMLRTTNMWKCQIGTSVLPHPGPLYWYGLTEIKPWIINHTHWVMWDINPYPCPKFSGRVTHICVSKLIIIGSDNGLSPDRRQTIIWTNARLLLIGPLGTNFSEILIEIHHFHSRKCVWKCRLRNGGHFVSASMC